MHCPYCHSEDTQVVDSRPAEDGLAIRRRRRCPECGKRFTTYERVDLAMPTVVKRAGDRREFSREKLRDSMMLALRKRPVSTEEVDGAVGRIESCLIHSGEREVSSQKIGALVLDELRKLDLVAYIRFASVYFNVDRPEAFEKLLREIKGGRTGHSE